MLTTHPAATSIPRISTRSVHLHHFLESIFSPHSRIELLGIIPDDGSVFLRDYVAAADHDAICDWIVRAIDYELDAYYSVVAHDGDIRYTTAVVVDVDGVAFGLEVEVVRSALADLGLAPSFIVSDGGDFEIYWILSTPTKDLEIIENLARRIASTLWNAGIPATTLDRMLARVPGTLDFGFSPPRRVEIVYCSGRCYSFDYLFELATKNNAPEGAHKEVESYASS